MKLPTLPRAKYTGGLIDKRRQASKLYPGITFDTALPQDWVNRCTDLHNFDPRDCVVWGYPPLHVFGLPLPLNQIALKALTDMGVCYDE